MKKLIFPCLFLFAFSICASAQLDLSKKIPGIKYESKYTFEMCTKTESVFYNKNGVLKSTIPYSTYYNKDFSHICVAIHRGGNSMYYTLFDMPNNNCLILMGSDESLTGSAAVLKEKNEAEYKTLQLSKTDEVKEILGKRCAKFTFDVSEFKGEMWITEEVTEIPNDLGVLKASKMGKFYEKISADGFVMEITSITPKGKKTLIRTKELFVKEHKEIAVPSEFGASLNKLDYNDY